MALRVTSVLLVSATILAWLAPRSAEARALAQPEDEVTATVDEPAVADDDAEVVEARRLFNEGASKFETADYAGAIELWTQAYALVPNLPENASIKAKLIANLASAQKHAYEVDHETSHLNQAKILLQSYQAVINDIYTSAAERESELAWIAERVREIDAELKTVAEREAAERDRLAAQNQPGEPEPRLAPGQGLVIGGSVLTGLGVAGIGVMVTGMVLGSSNNDISDLPTNEFDARSSRFAQGRLGNTLALVGGVGGAVLLGAGVALLAVGIKKKRAAGQEDAAQATLVPVLDPTLVGLGLVGRF